LDKSRGTTPEYFKLKILQNKPGKTMAVNINTQKSTKKKNSPTRKCKIPFVNKGRQIYLKIKPGGIRTRR
jgi:hypothetical protein